MASEIKVDTISEKTSAGGVTIDSVVHKDSAVYPSSADGGALGSASNEWSDLFLADSSVIKFGADQDTTLTHTDGTGLTLNSTNKLCFNDASQFVQGSSATVLSIGATDEIDLTATAIDINGTCDISGTFSLGGTNITTTAAEINLIDGGTARGTTALASGDGILINDGGTMRMTNVDTVKTFMATAALAGIDDQSSSNDDQLTIKDDEMVINEDSDAYDFRVESNLSTHALLCDSSESHVCMFGTRNSVNTAAHSASNEDGQFSYGLDGRCAVSCSDSDTTVPMFAANRVANDGELMAFHLAGTKAGTISVASSTVAYNTFTGAHWSQLSDNSRPTILRGTVMETINQMCEWYQVEYTVKPEKGGGTVKKSIDLAGRNVGDLISYTDEDGDVYNDLAILKEENDTLPKCKISDTEASTSVYGVHMNWDGDVGTGDFDMNIAALGTFVIRIKNGVTVDKGDLLESAGDGTAQKQGDTIIKSSTIAKVTANITIETFGDGSYLVPCTLHCG